MKIKVNVVEDGVEDVLKENSLNLRESDNPDREPIDFCIEDEEDNVAWVWGKTPDNVSVECDHAVIEYGDEDEMGECLVCGALCDWHWEEDTGNVEGHHWEGKRQVPHQWYNPDKPSGVIGDYLNTLKGGDNAKKS